MEDQHEGVDEFYNVITCEAQVQTATTPCHSAENSPSRVVSSPLLAKAEPALLFPTLTEFPIPAAEVVVTKGVPDASAARDAASGAYADGRDPGRPGDDDAELGHAMSGGQLRWSELPGDAVGDVIGEATDEPRVSDDINSAQQGCCAAARHGNDTMSAEGIVTAEILSDSEQRGITSKALASSSEEIADERMSPALAWADYAAILARTRFLDVTADVGADEESIFSTIRERFELAGTIQTNELMEVVRAAVPPAQLAKIGCILDDLHLELQTFCSALQGA